jgi:type II secretory pathway pseudopilin PulG
VIVVIGILIAAAAPSFLGQQDKAHDSDIKQSLSVAYKTARAEAVELGGRNPTGTRLRDAIIASEPQLTGKVEVLSDRYEPTSAGRLGICASSSGSSLRLVGRSQSGTNFRLVAGSNGLRITGDADCNFGRVLELQSGPTLVAVPGGSGAITAEATWDGTPTSLIWNWETCPTDEPRGCVTVGTGETYTPVIGDRGRYLRVIIIAVDDAGESDPAVSALVGPVVG